MNEAISQLNYFEAAFNHSKYLKSTTHMRRSFQSKQNKGKDHDEAGASTTIRVDIKKDKETD